MFPEQLATLPGWGGSTLRTIIQRVEPDHVAGMPFPDICDAVSTCLVPKLGSYFVVILAQEPLASRLAEPVLLGCPCRRGLPVT